MDPSSYPSFCTTCMQMNCKEHMQISTLEKCHICHSPYKCICDIQIECNTLHIWPTCLKNQCICGMKKSAKIIFCGCFCDE